MQELRVGRRVCVGVPTRNLPRRQQRVPGVRRAVLGRGLHRPREDFSPHALACLSFIVVLALSDESGLCVVPQRAVGRRLRGGVSARNLHQRRQRLPSVRRRVRARMLRRRTSHARLTSSHHHSRCSHECITELRFRARLTALRVRTLSWATPVWRNAQLEHTPTPRSCVRPATTSATPTDASAQYVSLYFTIYSSLATVVFHSLISKLSSTSIDYRYTCSLVWIWVRFG